MDGGADFVGVCDAAGGGGGEFCGLQEGDDLEAAGGVAEADERERGIAAHHRGRIVQHFQECFVEGGLSGVLAHDPGVCVANFFDGMSGEADQIWIQRNNAGIVMGHVFPELHERVLNVAGVLFIGQVFGDLFVGEMAAEPGVPPEEEGHEDDEPGGEEEEGAVAGGHFVMRRRGGLSGGIFRGDLR